jgi:hypothetical protein
MRRRKKYAQQPMLYIQQPNLEQPSASMQADYRTPKKKKNQSNLESEQTAKGKKKVTKKRPVEKKETDIVYGDKDEVVEALQDEDKLESDLDSSSEKESNESLEGEQLRRKRFGDMSVEEKVNYFISLPTQVPRMKCEVTTEDERHRGIITDFQDGYVHMVTVRRPRDKKLDIKDIQNIRLIGF